MINEKRTLMDFDHTSDMLSNGSHKKVWRVCEGCGKEEKVLYYSYVGGCIQCRSCAQTGLITAEETRKKMSVNHANMSGENHPMYGKYHSTKTKRKISKSCKDRVVSTDTKQRISKSKSGVNHPMYGKHHSDETKQRISESNTGKITSVETRQLISESCKGRKVSTKTRQKISMTAQGVDEKSWGGYITDTPYPIEFTQLLRKEIRMSTNDCDFLTGIHKNICNDGYELAVHHIDYDKQNCRIENLIPLSRSNHAKTNINREFWTKLFTNMQNTRYLLLELDEEQT